MMKNITVPDLMKGLPFDKKRNIPIPYVVLIDNLGEPQYKINDERKVNLCLKNRVCNICGNPLKKEYWFIGGQLSAFHPRGAFNDGAVHRECGLYALSVCPYMLNSNYKAITDTGKLADKIKDNANFQALYNPTQSLERLTFFCFVKTKDYSLKEHPVIKGIFVVLPKKPYEQVEFYLNGERIHKAKARQLLRDKREADYLP